jgi:hypothetical protein
MNKQKVRTALQTAGISFTEEEFLGNGFWGTRFVLANIKAAKAAAKVLGERVVISRYFKQYEIVFF